MCLRVATETSVCPLSTFDTVEWPRWPRGRSPPWSGVSSPCPAPSLVAAVFRNTRRTVPLIGTVHLPAPHPKYPRNFRNFKPRWSPRRAVLRLPAPCTGGPVPRRTAGSAGRAGRRRTASTRRRRCRRRRRRQCPATLRMPGDRDVHSNPSGRPWSRSTSTAAASAASPRRSRRRSADPSGALHCGHRRRPLRPAGHVAHDAADDVGRGADRHPLGESIAMARHPMPRPEAEAGPALDSARCRLSLQQAGAGDLRRQRRAVRVGGGGQATTLRRQADEQVVVVDQQRPAAEVVPLDRRAELRERALDGAVPGCFRSTTRNRASCLAASYQSASDSQRNERTSGPMTGATCVRPPLATVMLLEPQ